ncbi:EF-P lysine aminoacylase GenX [Candidatus Peregrinibacteria bacterium HGW-Peregrinibacteria-1]|jgi:lysyl-tRNA synthetase class 2|nr:MAG: EF-P lysine aminoacylase GenX [Candidatus Peregrinibacteria bacterium HGW-Peregrinibacteria-1]
MIEAHTLKQISTLYREIRRFFDQQDFIEVHTPIMTPIPGMEPHLTPFETTLTTPLDNKQYPVYLNTSPELQMKRLLGAGLEKIYNITKVFRDYELGGGRHNPEFTMLEWYRQKADYFDLMTDCENLITTLLPHSNPNPKIDFTTPWDRATTQELFHQYCDIDLNQNQTFEKISQTAIFKNLDIAGCQDWDDIFFKIFLNHIEPHLGINKPIFIYEYPATQAALSKKSTKNTFFAERFELYIDRQEIANAFSELIDPDEQTQRLKEEQELRKSLNKRVFPIDEQFIASLKSIKHPSAGIALGIDRLFMVLLNKLKIEEVILFPMDQLLKENFNNQ